MVWKAALIPLALLAGCAKEGFSNDELADEASAASRRIYQLEARVSDLEGEVESLKSQNKKALELTARQASLVGEMADAHSRLAKDFAELKQAARNRGIY